MNDIEALLKGVLPEKKKKIRISKNEEIHDLVKGEYVTENVFLVENKFKTNYLHQGNELKKYQIHPLILKYTGLENANIQDLLFIDTETTGLAGGTGTYVFLIGIGYFTEDEFILKQYFLSDIANEKELIEQFIKELNKEKIYVSFNGKSYDVPLLNTRSILYGCKANITAHGNIDLLHISRRIWRDKLENYSLQNIEQNILNSSREGELDIPGSAIPEAYFNYLDSRNAKVMQNVIYHNKLDILSLTVLLEKINSILYSNNFADVNLFEIGRIFLQNEFYEKAISIFRSIIECEPAHLLAIRELSFIHKRNEDLIKASELWLQAVKHDEYYAYIELAKWEEHKNKNYQIALEWTEKALNSKYEDYVYEGDVVQQLKHRKQRLEMKIHSKSNST
ncbi:MAG: ribonuclease H-like domain-containing protein [Candidatus Cloacimonetes bacterium]|nr:ribonuclease H-like domain-containing protein [Candidatus Cloacimonadota bacterium]